MNNNELIQAVIASLNKSGLVKSGDLIMLGKVLSFLNGYHISKEQLILELSDYINLGYFEIINERIKVTQLGIEKLKING